MAMAAQGEKDRGTHIRDKWDMQATKIEMAKRDEMLNHIDAQYPKSTQVT